MNTLRGTLNWEVFKQGQNIGTKKRETMETVTLVHNPSSLFPVPALWATTLLILKPTLNASQLGLNADVVFLYPLPSQESIEAEKAQGVGAKSRRRAGRLRPFPALRLLPHAFTA